MIVGRHAFVDGWEADPALLDDEGRMVEALLVACEDAGATPLHWWSHHFEPQGVTVVIALAESHASLHTSPEHGHYSADMYTCGELDPAKAMDGLMRVLGGTARGWYVTRGEDSPPRPFVSREPEDDP